MIIFVRNFIICKYCVIHHPIHPEKMYSTTQNRNQEKYDIFYLEVIYSALLVRKFKWEISTLRMRSSAQILKDENTWHILVNFEPLCPILVHFKLLLFILVNLCQLGSCWEILLHFNSFWWITLVHLLRFLLILNYFEWLRSIFHSFLWFILIH